MIIIIRKRILAQQNEPVIFKEAKDSWKRITTYLDICKKW